MNNQYEKKPVLKYFCLETTTRCNLQCIHCVSSKENNPGGFEYFDLPMSLFDKILPMLEEFRPSIQLNGDGETLLHPDFMQMLENLTQAGCPVTYQTNGMLLTPQNVEQSIRGGVENIWISIDAATPQLFAEIRRNARLEKIIENIRLINEIKNRLGTETPKICFRFTAMRKNIHELPSVVKLSGELKAAALMVGGLCEYNLTRGQSLVNEPLMTEWLTKAREEGQNWAGLKLWFPVESSKTAPQTPTAKARVVDPANPLTYKGMRKTCNEPWERMFMRASGKVQPCCNLDPSYGDLSVQSLEEIWLGPKYQNLRSSLLTDKPLDACAQCTLYGWEPIDLSQNGGTTNASDAGNLLQKMIRKLFN